MKFCILYGYENGIRLRWETLRGASLRVEKLRSRPYKIFRRATICLKTLMTIAYFLKIIVRVFFQCLTSQGPIFGGCAPKTIKRTLTFAFAGPKQSFLNSSCFGRFGPPKKSDSHTRHRWTRFLTLSIASKIDPKICWTLRKTEVQLSRMGAAFFRGT